MAQNLTTTVTSVFLNNAKSATTVATRTVEAMVVDNQLVADIRQTNPGVINNAYTEKPIVE